MRCNVMELTFSPHLRRCSESECTLDSRLRSYRHARALSMGTCQHGMQKLDEAWQPSLAHFQT